MALGKQINETGSNKHQVGQWFSKKVPRVAASVSPGNVLEM